MEKPVDWVGSCLDDLRELPEDVRDEFGFALYQLQVGEMPANTKPMRGSLREVLEITVVDRSSTYRLACTLKVRDHVFALHVFQKKAKHGKSTPKRDLDLIERRLQIARFNSER